MVLNDYKYIVVPKKFDDFKKENQYQTSTLIKHLFAQKGFEVFYEDDLPMELYSDRCLGLTVRLDNKSSMFTTKVVLDMVDCLSKTVYSTLEGRSKEKEYKASYNEAIREAFRSLESFEYGYTGKAENKEPITVSFRNDVKQLEETAMDKAKPVNKKEVMVQQEATRENQFFKDRTPVKSNITKSTVDSGTPEVVRQVATPDVQEYESKEPVPSKIGKQDSDGIAMEAKSALFGSTLYAQELANGYQLVDSTPSIVMKLFQSSLPEVFHAKTGDTVGMVYKKEGKWYFEYYATDNRMVEELNIKF